VSCKPWCGARNYNPGGNFRFIQESAGYVAFCSAACRDAGAPTNKYAPWTAAERPVRRCDFEAHEFCWRHGICTAHRSDECVQHGTVCRELSEVFRNVLTHPDAPWFWGQTKEGG
jgi:hypothetical protein